MAPPSLLYWTAAVTILVVIATTFRNEHHVANALYFYLEGQQTRCFLEELPKGTLVSGNYSSEVWSEAQQAFVKNQLLGIQITVKELPERHLIVNQKGGASGTFTFTAAESCDHDICLSTNSTGWFSANRVRIHTEFHVGELENNGEIDEKLAIGQLAQRIKNLNYRVIDVKREQEFQRDTESKFRDQSESTNSRVVYWALCQIVVLGATCVWQLRHLRGFFEAKKLV